MDDRAPFAGGDQDYLRDEQYGDTSKLDVRTALHQRFSTADLAFPDFEAARIEWPPSARVLECGTGSGRFWDTTVVPRTVELTLTDLSPGMVDAAHRRATAAGFQAVVARECDVQELPFADDSFDVVLPGPCRSWVRSSRCVRTSDPSSRTAATSAMIVRSHVCPGTTVR